MSNRTFSDYVADRRTGYKYTIKFALPEVNDAMLDLLETCLGKYNLVSATKFRSTPIQLAPLEFPNIKSTPVHSSDIELEYPASLDFLKTYIANSLTYRRGKLQCILSMTLGKLSWTCFYRVPPLILKTLTRLHWAANIRKPGTNRFTEKRIIWSF